MNLLEVATASVEKAFADGVEARAGQLCANIASGNAESECEKMFRNAVAQLKQTREIALRIVGEVFPSS